MAVGVADLWGVVFVQTASHGHVASAGGQPAGDELRVINGTVLNGVAVGGIDAVVNNAGVPAAGPIELADLDEARSLFEVNFFGALATTQAFLPLLRKGQGRIVNIGSRGAFRGEPRAPAYGAAKAGLHAMSQLIAHRGPDGHRGSLRIVLELVPGRHGGRVCRAGM